MEEVLPRAAEIRNKTMGGNPERLSLRHLLFALAQQSHSSWPPLENGKRPSSESLAELRTKVATYVADNPAIPGESRTAWFALASEAPEMPVSPSLPESTPLHSDNPSVVDLLGRRPLVKALAIRLKRLQAEEAASPEPAAVMVHLHGAWGSGKSSMVRLLAAELSEADPPWLVVDFNAWRNARVKPPWWNMLTTMKQAVARRLLKRAALVRWIVADPALFQWAMLQIRWGLKSPTFDTFALICLLIVLVGLAAAGGGTDKLIQLFNQSGVTLSSEGVKNVSAMVTAIAAVFGGVRWLLLGGKRVAEGFDALRTDSYRPFIDLFTTLEKASPVPVLIVLDDLDRCDSGTVTDLLEGIQTLFRGAPVVFLAVADRRWITASFAKRFTDFEEAGGDAARPVGDLFLDKMFQLSVGVPYIGEAAKDAYLRQLLKVATTVMTEPAPPLPPDIVTLEAGRMAIEAAKPEQRAAVITQVALRLSEYNADEKTGHRLLEWSSLIEPNPRAMKRLVNAVGMAQSRVVLEQRDVDFDTLALWTILELGWPAAAEEIVKNPDIIKSLANGEYQSDSNALAVAMRDPHFRKLVQTADLNPLYLAPLIDNPQFKRSKPSRIRTGALLDRQSNDQ